MSTDIKEEKQGETAPIDSKNNIPQITGYIFVGEEKVPTYQSHCSTMRKLLEEIGEVKFFSLISSVAALSLSLLAILAAILLR